MIYLIYVKLRYKCARRDVSNSKKYEKKGEAFFFFAVILFFSRFVSLCSFLVSFCRFFFICLSFFRTALPDRRAATARVLRQDVACRRSQKLLLGIFLHIHTHRARAVVCVYACVSARCSMSGDAGSSSSSRTGRLLKFCFSSAVALSGSLVLALPLFLCRATAPCTCAQFNFLLKLWQPPWNERTTKAKRRRSIASIMKAHSWQCCCCCQCQPLSCFFVLWEIMLSYALSLALAELSRSAVRASCVSTLRTYFKACTPG